MQGMTSSHTITSAGWDEDARFYNGTYPSWWQSIAQTDEWKAWYDHASHNMLYDVDESLDCGFMSEAHAKDFLKFVREVYGKP
jgi:hypothetical protein